MASEQRKERLVGIREGRAHVARLKSMRVWSPGTSGLSLVGGGNTSARNQGKGDAIRSAIRATNTRQRRWAAGNSNGGQFKGKG